MYSSPPHPSSLQQQTPITYQRSQTVTYQSRLPQDMPATIQQRSVNSSINQHHSTNLYDQKNVIISQQHAQIVPNQQVTSQFAKTRVVPLIEERQVQQLPAVAPSRRVEYVPYEQKYIEYVEQRVRVPVQRMCTDYYRIEHIVDYVPIEKQEIIYVKQAREVVNMRLEYVPVEQKIIHISDKNAKALGITDYVSCSATDNPDIHASPLYQPLNPNYKQGNSIQGLNSQNSLKKSKTNFITCQGYDPESNLKQIDRILSQSSVRGSRVRS